MKKLIAIFFVTIYAATCFGVVARCHYCNRVLTHVSMSNSAGKAECNSDSFIPKDCCDEKSICFQISGQRTTEQPYVLLPKFQQAELAPFPESIFVIPETTTYKPSISFHTHQRTVPQKIYLLNRVFRI